MATDAWLLAAVLDNLVEGVATINQDGIIRLVNPATVRIFGYERKEELIDQNVQILMPPIYRLGHQSSLVRYLQTGQTTIIGKVREAEGLRKDGSVFPIELAISKPIHVGGEIIFAGVIRDITERKELQARDKQHAIDTDHRVKNLFAVFLAILHQSDRDSKSKEEFASDAQRRVLGLAEVHNLLSTGPRSRADLKKIVEARTFPHRGENVLHIDGPTILLPPQQAQDFGMVVDELTSNAAKYGAIKDGGHLSITWSDREGEVVFHWEERTNTPLVPPAKENFGLRLVERTVRQNLRGQVTLDFTSQGLHCTIRFSKPPS